MNCKREMVIYSQQIAIELRKRGFKIVKTEINHRYPQYDIYIFDNTKEFREAFNEIVRGKFGYREDYLKEADEIEFEKETGAVLQVVSKSDETDEERPRRTLHLSRFTDRYNWFK